MGLRTTLGSRVEAVIGRDRADALRRAERSGRTALARRLAPAPPLRKPPATGSPTPRWGPSDPPVPHPTPTMSRHELLAGLHERVQPRTYLEIGVNTGASLALSRARSVGVDPAFKVEAPLHCDVQLVRATSDDFFAAEEPLAHLGGVPVDLAFIDGMHLAEFAMRDFINTEPLMAQTGVVVFDDVLPRNGLEAARGRRTQAWAGDVYKAVEVLRRRRPDLVVLLVNTAPTGTAVVLGTDPTSAVLSAAYPDELAYLTSADPQTPPQDYLDRSVAVDPHALLESPVWAELVARREAGGPPDLSGLWDRLGDLRNG